MSTKTRTGVRWVVILAAVACMGAGAQASTGLAKDCTLTIPPHMRVRLTLASEGAPVDELLIKSAVNRVWAAKGMKVEWVAVDPAQRPWSGVDLWVNIRKSEVNKAVDTAANRISREYLIQPISAHHLLFAERKGAVEEVLGDSVADEIRKFLSSAQCEQGR